ncbi:cytochrome b [Lysobacter sp.]|uniref:cytochrome b n=1 Tax=Lysobacter sp. TaxID=72226 RepID=UPI002D7266ED|nr:cytochrome b [Lysobacter sp.]HZX76083.1 cytochrome b [Lysobacter sp.]
MFTRANRYSRGLRALHWLTALLILAAYLAIEQRGLFARGTPARTAMVQAHFWFGLCVFAFALWRVTLRMRHRMPAVSPPLPVWQAVPAGLLHVALYAFLLVMPVLGLLTVWADGKAVQVPLTSFVLPALIAPDTVLAGRLEDLHGGIGECFYWVIGLHVLAALYHHYVRRDDTLRRML